MSQTMSTPNRLWEKWAGRLVDGKFPLKGWLGGSDHSAVFLTERGGGTPQRAALKLIPADNLDADEQFSRWAVGAEHSHPHLIRLFQYGRCSIDGAPFLYVVMEHAEETLAEILPLRALSPVEVSEMLRPAGEALAALHQAGFIHSRIKPSNVMAVDNKLKLSSDGLRKAADRDNRRPAGGYDAPEVATVGLSAAADMWSLGMTLLAVSTQSEPRGRNEPRGKIDELQEVSVPKAIPEPLHGILERCLQIDPARRCSANDILKQASTQPSRTRANVDARTEPYASETKLKRWTLIPIAAVALVVATWIGSKMLHHQPAAPAPQSPTVSGSGEVSEGQPPAASAPLSEKERPAQTGIMRGSVLQQVLPEVSRGAQNTITGHVRVSVQVAVDASGNVSDAKFVSPGPSKYFAARAMAAARRWKFNPPMIAGKPAASDWVLRFQFGPAATQVSPIETKP
jgi:TonB family protein